MRREVEEMLITWWETPYDNEGRLVWPIKLVHKFKGTNDSIVLGLNRERAEEMVKELTGLLAIEPYEDKTLEAKLDATPEWTDLSE